jgi:pteridine reductase
MATARRRTGRQNDAAQRVALVTGGAVRIGRAIVEALASRGWAVVLTYQRSASAARALTAGLTAQWHAVTATPMDVTVADQRAHTLELVRECFGRLDALVNNAAAFPRTPIDALDPSTLEAVLRTNLTSPTMLALEAAPLLRASSGAIVNLLDIYGQYPLRHHLAYSISKAGFAMATKALAVELAPAVRVNGVAPGIAQFPADYDEQTRARLLARTLLGRAGDADEIARAVAYLLEDTSTMTGQVLVIDGGRTVAL